MTKDQLQQELKEKVKAGIKPSDLRKLKRSKSEGDIPQAPPLPNITPRRKSIDLLGQESLTKKFTEATDQISILELKIETKDRELAEKDLEIKELKKNPPNLLLTDQLKEKQKQIEHLQQQGEDSAKQIESLRTKLELTHHQLTKSNTELDQSLQARYEAVKQFGVIYDKLQEIKSELQKNVEQASDELIDQDQTITKLRTKQNKTQLRIQTLESQLKASQKDWQLASRLAELRSNSGPNSEPESYLKYALYGLVAVCLITLLNSSWKNNQNHE